jgi:hypothetical protein
MACTGHCEHVDELLRVRQWFVTTIRVVGFLGPFAGAGVAVIALVVR